MNILTFDIEEWFLDQQIPSYHNATFVKYDRCLNSVLDLLDEKGFKATFFCLGKVAELFPDIVKTISDRGHEIGCHSNTHTWLTQLTPEQLKADTHEAIARLEDVTGAKVVSYRAPAFSIGKSNKWAFEILAENGIERDASIYPATRDFGGFSDFGHKKPCIVECRGMCIKEFPMPTTKLLTKETAYSGGGYFRLLPYTFIEKTMKESPYNICYFHIGDLVPEKEKWMDRATYEACYKESGTFVARLSRHFKSNVGRRKAFNKMARLFDHFKFIDLRQADTMTIWESAERVRL